MHVGAGLENLLPLVLSPDHEGVHRPLDVLLVLLPAFPDHLAGLGALLVVVGVLGLPRGRTAQGGRRGEGVVWREGRGGGQEAEGLVVVGEGGWVHGQVAQEGLVKGGGEGQAGQEGRMGRGVG